MTFYQLPRLFSSVFTLLGVCLAFCGPSRAGLPVGGGSVPLVDVAVNGPLFAVREAQILPSVCCPVAVAVRAQPFSNLFADFLPGSFLFAWNCPRDLSLPLAGWGDVLDVACLGSFSVPLRADAGERTNILLAGAAVDNCVVMPGATFSFNRVVGERTPARGFADGLMFAAGRVVRGTGGGICLVSTALYNSALRAGLPITERHGHSGVVSYALPGLDASVVYGSEDLCFVNVTPQPLLVKTTLENDRLTVGLFGATPVSGREIAVKTVSLRVLPAPTVQTVDLSLPPASCPVVDQTPRAGYRVVVDRVWTRRGKPVRTETVANETRLPRAKIVRIPAPVVAVPPPVASPAVPLVSPPADTGI